MSSFKNRARAAQLIDFKGLQWGKLRPTDIDLSLDWGGDTFVFVEVKGAHAPLTIGQRIHLEGLVDAIQAGGKMAYAIVSKHATRANEDIQAANTIVYSVYAGDKWFVPEGNYMLDDYLNELYDGHLMHYPKRGK